MRGPQAPSFSAVMTRALLPIALTAIALAGCSSEDPADTTAAPTGAASSTAAAASTSSAAAPTSAAAAATAVAGCPVDAATLQKAFQANAEVAGAIILG